MMDMKRRGGEGRERNRERETERETETERASPIEGTTPLI
jgi:hypothetical protein